ncbi:hypothetical protein OESDEN_11524 [Oesophagostomum dentatum]|uniref:Uncharacterized protein n=1 Tax=Oesophagostomum dentatum TaxID=61180 RepID=A0A0B1STS0_OESDE|nr:hypothetical protein OESDEN_11524 [Oesophagostomum dentatum]
MYYGRNCELQRSMMESNMLWVMENAHTVFPAFSVITTFMILFVIYFACLSRRYDVLCTTFIDVVTLSINF